MKKSMTIVQLKDELEELAPYQTFDMVYQNLPNNGIVTTFYYLRMNYKSILRFHDDIYEFGNFGDTKFEETEAISKAIVDFLSNTDPNSWYDDFEDHSLQL